jgi:hypothetical protein
VQNKLKKKQKWEETRVKIGVQWFFDERTTMWDLFIALGKSSYESKVMSGYYKYVHLQTVLTFIGEEMGIRILTT